MKLHLTTRLLLAAMVLAVANRASANEYSNTPAIVGGPKLVSTERELDIALDGPGYLQVSDPEGSVMYTRRGDLMIDENRSLVVRSAGQRLVEPAISIPHGTTMVVIAPSGSVMAKLAGSPQLVLVGQLQLAVFASPEHLEQVDRHTFSQTDRSGAPTTGEPGKKGMGLVRQGFLHEVTRPLGN